MAGDAVIFSHFIAINVVVGAANRSEQVLSFRPDHASVTKVEVERRRHFDRRARARGRDGGETGVLLGR